MQINNSGMKKIALTNEEMNELQDYGIDISIASMKWVQMPTANAIIYNTNEYTWELLISRTEIEYSIPAFTLQDIIELLPRYIYIDCMKYGLDIFIDDIKGEWNVAYSRCDCSPEQKLEYSLIESSSEIIDAAYHMLIKCIKNCFLIQG